MANQSDDASKGGDSTKSTDLGDAFKDLKTRFDEAEENGGKADSDEDDKDDDTTDKDAEADNANDSDNSDDQGDQDGDDDAGDGNGDDSDDSGDGDAKGKQGSEFRFTQLKHDGTPEGYRKALEQEYINSSQEGIKQRERADILQRKVDAITAAAGKDPEFGEKLISLLKGAGGDGNSQDSKDDFGGKVTQESKSPFLVHAETEWNAKNDESIKEFVDANPEVLTDPKINKEVKRWTNVFTREVYEQEGRLITTGEAMAKAFDYLGYEDKRKSQQDLVNGMKKNAAPTRPQGAKKKPSGNGGNTKQFSDLTLNIADKMGISKERLVKGSKR